MVPGGPNDDMEFIAIDFFRQFYFVRFRLWMWFSLVEMIRLRNEEELR